LDKSNISSSLIWYYKVLIRYKYLHPSRSCTKEVLNPDTRPCVGLHNTWDVISIKMFFTLKEIVNWLGITVFEIWSLMLCTTVFTVLTALKFESLLNMDWWTTFSPLFVCDLMNAYFCAIVFIRMYLDGIYKAAAFRAIWSFSVLILLFVFKLLLCQKLEGLNSLHYSEVMSPVFILAQLVMIRACQLHWWWTDCNTVFDCALSICCDCLEVGTN